mmetsp:Transcript_7597/g.7463  ORF Transcript_7597/g.7463 Transcript_7597/m.7463 type:complete len:94 (-) Transcript_7597:539-820(-)
MEQPTPEQEDYEKRKDKWFPLEGVKELISIIKGNVGKIFCKEGMDKSLKLLKLQLLQLKCSRDCFTLQCFYATTTYRYKSFTDSFFPSSREFY